MDSSFIPTYEDVPPGPTRSQSTQGRRPLLEILRHHHSSVPLKSKFSVGLGIQSLTALTGKH
ncbi:hypothetical protein C366_01435 [Cryptococcus neoformans Tu401-1]|nr:hypothetical protein C366_01435 [Cryptococcus neoformans var. grubii Tu401-1]